LSISAIADGSSTGNIEIAGNVPISGFSSVSLQAAGATQAASGLTPAATAAGTGELAFLGQSGSAASLSVLGTSTPLSITAGRIVAQSGVSAGITTLGALTVASTGSPYLSRPAGAGASLQISAQSVDMAGRIDLPGGAVQIETTGSIASDGITLESGSSIRVAGLTQSFGTTSADLSAGSISLSTPSGSIAEQVGATLDLSGSGTQGDAGSLSLSAPSGSVDISGSLALAAPTTARGAGVAIDANTFDLGTLSSAINQGAASGGATLTSIDVRARSGNLTLASGSSLKAGSITLEADGSAGAADGSVQIAGVLDASGASGGSIGLYANNQVALQAGGVLDASASAAGATGGNIVISSRVTPNLAAPATPDAIVLDPNARISVGGGAAGSGGTITLRANAMASGGTTPSDVEVAALPVAMLQASGSREVNVEGVIVDSRAGNVTIDSTLLATEQTKLSAYMSAANIGTMTTRLLGGASLAGFSMRPGLEIDASGTLTVASPIEFATGLALNGATGTVQCSPTCGWRYGGTTLAGSVPGDLVLRSAGNLLVNANISDGFLPTAASATINNNQVWNSTSGGDSWSYTLSAGADLLASNPGRVGSSAADLTIGTANFSAPVVIRTGTGSISLNASEDVVLRNTYGQENNNVYTAGIANIANLPAFPSLSGYAIDNNGNQVFETIKPVLTQDGGDFSIHAGRDILGTDSDGSNPDGSDQTVNEWLFREGTTGSTVNAPNVWWVQFDQFMQGFGALGGGNLSLNSGRDIVRVGGVVAGVGYSTGSATSEFNDGSLDVRAGGNVQQGLFYDESGTLALRAAAVTDNQNADNGLLTVTRFAQGDNTIDVQVRLASSLALSFNPTTVDPSVVNLSSTTPSTFQSFFTFGDATHFNARVASGDLDVTQIVAASYNLESLGGNWSVAPPSLDLIAFGGGFVQQQPTPVVVFPSATGQVRVLATGDISGLELTMSQADPALQGTAGAPVFINAALASQRLSTPLAGAVPLHANDTSNAEFVSLDGSINDAVLSLPKAADVIAGVNIGPNALFDIQNANAGSLTRVTAGGTLDLSGQSGIGFSHILIGGPGAAEILSGGPMNLGTRGAGIESRGNFDNPNLPAQGASLLVAAGVGVDAQGLAVQPDAAGAIRNFVRYDAFADEGSESAALNAQVIAVIGTDSDLGSAAPLFAQALTAALADRTSADNPASAINQAIVALTPAQLLRAGVKLASTIQVVNNQRFVASQNKDTFAPGYTAFDDLFPNLDANAAAVTHFVQNNPFAAAPDPAQLQGQALAGLPAPLADAIRLGLAAPSTASDPNSAFAQALAKIDPATLASGARELLANVLQVAGTSLDALKASGRVTGSGSPYAKSLTALAAAFSPATAAGLNDLQMDYNQIKVDQTGWSAVFAPQGSVVVGQSAAQALAPGQKAKSASQLGVFTLGGGDIIGMVRDNFDVYRSRVFTVAGGDIDLWSSLGNLDAGRGPRDVAVAAPPRVVVDPSTGLQYLDLGAAVTGSGIGALETQPNQPPSNINLMAPAGYVDAGEAGIRAQTGTVTLGTNLVLNAGNIQAASGISGGAVVAAPPPPLPTSTLTSAGEKAVEQAQREALGEEAAEQRLRNQQNMRVTGEFLGYGDPCSDEARAKDPSKCQNEKK
jgi:hypothetical protein